MPTPKKFGFIRATLALWAADIGTFVRGGVVSDSPNGGNAWGVNIPGVGWIYAAMRDSDERFNSVDSLTNYRVNGTSVIDSSRNVKGEALWSGGAIRIDRNGDFTGRNQTLTGWLTLNGATRPEWGSSWAATMLGGTSAIVNVDATGNERTLISNNMYFDGVNLRAIASNATRRYPCYLMLDVNGGIALVSSQTLPTAGGVISDLATRFQANRFGGIGCFGVTPPTTRPTVNAAATDLATVIALTNQLRSALIACGLVQ